MLSPDDLADFWSNPRMRTQGPCETLDWPAFSRMGYRRFDWWRPKTTRLFAEFNWITVLVLRLSGSGRFHWIIERFPSFGASTKFSQSGSYCREFQDACRQKIRLLKVCSYPARNALCSQNNRSYAEFTLHRTAATLAIVYQTRRLLYRQESGILFMNGWRETHVARPNRFLMLLKLTMSQGKRFTDRSARKCLVHKKYLPSQRNSPSESERSKFYWVWKALMVVRMTPKALSHTQKLVLETP